MPLLRNGRFSSAIWAARLTVVMENLVEGERLTNAVLNDTNVRAAIETVRKQPSKWLEAMEKSGSDLN